MQTPQRNPVASGLGLLAFSGLTAGVAAASGKSSRPGLWYLLLRKPKLTPPGPVFPVVWTALYALIAVSGWRVWRRRERAGRGWALGLWGTQLGLNGLWSWLFFGQRRARASLADVGLMLAAIAAYARAAERIDPPAAWMMTPYLGWTAFAAALNEEIVRRNPRLTR
ncbi:MAG TPA: TspO/MBR family protein [Myxococcaceae bacterium]|nr:TspO/MBR family protein [Myxococcaceae bacterium]